MSTVIPLSYLVRQAEQQVCAYALGPWFRDIAQADIGNVNVWAYDLWTRDNHEFYFPYQGKASQLIRVVFDYKGFDPTQSNWDYGKPQLSPPVIDERPNHTYMFDNRQGVSALAVKLAESVVLSQSRTDTTANRWHLDLGSKQKVTIGGDKEPAGFEFEAHEEWGISFDASTAKAEGENRTETEEINTSVPPGHATLATLATPRVRSKQEYHLNGLLDCAIKITGIDQLTTASERSRWDELTNAPSSRVYRTSDYGGFWFDIHFDTFDDLVSCANGYNVDFPRVQSALAPGSLASLDGDRTVKFDGIINRDYQTSSAYQFQDIPADKVEAAITAHSIPRERVLTA